MSNVATNISKGMPANKFDWNSFDTFVKIPTALHQILECAMLRTQRKIQKRCNASINPTRLAYRCKRRNAANWRFPGNKDRTELCRDANSAVRRVSTEFFRYHQSTAYISWIHASAVLPNTLLVGRGHFYFIYYIPTYVRRGLDNACVIVRGNCRRFISEISSHATSIIPSLDMRKLLVSKMVQGPEHYLRTLVVLYGPEG